MRITGSNMLFLAKIRIEDFNKKYLDSLKRGS
jgi:hypothetical protein